MFPRNPKNRRKKIIVWIIAFAVFFLFSYFLNFSQSFVTRGAMFVTQPLFYLKNTILSLMETRLFVFKGKKELISENLFLKQKIIELELSKNFLDEVMKENNELKLVFNFSEPENTEFILAPVFLRPGYGIYNTIVVGAGSNRGVKNGALVTAFGDTFLGYVYETVPGMSKVRLASYPGEETNVFIGGRFSAIAVGLGGENMEVSLPKDVEVEVGERVFTIDERPLFLGVVEVITKKPTDSFQKIIFRLPLNIQELRNVYLIKE